MNNSVTDKVQYSFLYYTERVCNLAFITFLVLNYVWAKKSANKQQIQKIKTLIFGLQYFHLTTTTSLNLLSLSLPMLLLVLTYLIINYTSKVYIPIQPLIQYS